MEVSNNDLARILGRIESKMEEQASATKRVEGGLTSLDAKVTLRLDEHDRRLRDLEVANPKETGETVKAHAERIQALERGAARAGVVAGIGSSVAIAALVELVKSRLGM